MSFKAVFRFLSELTAGLLNHFVEIISYPRWGGIVMVLQRVSLITIGAFNLPVLRSFYKKLGWEETEISSDHYAAFKTAGVILSIFPIEELAKDAGVEISQNVDSFRGVTFAINVNKPEEVDTTIDEIRKAGE
ncbi:VOC family protein [Peribacillus faecalis]|uniref:VOC family protein n=1 Tax=Peribacillus faecalis TaxID=2772559 RepID=UPI001F35E574|nr:hypothetical protein [Peribacillus faecalis]